uniref:Uncharacterized protein n=1 Tax=Knipowitschia caucasica TaxID=637954 RepID=A0AAV2JTI3_KNICA
MLSPGANATGSMAGPHEGGDLAAVLSELQSLRTDITSIHDKMSDIAGFGDKLDKLEERISDMNNAVTAVQGGFTSLKQDISANATRLNEAEDRIESAEESVQKTMKKRSQFNAVKKQFVEAGSFRGFQLQPCKMRIFHNGKIVTFSSPEEAENFLHK